MYMVWPFAIPAAWACMGEGEFEVLLLCLLLPQIIGDNKRHLKQFIILQDKQ
jgi:hypothetical protein